MRKMHNCRARLAPDQAAQMNFGNNIVANLHKTVKTEKTMHKKLCAAALMLGVALMLLQLRAHAGDGVMKAVGSVCQLR